MTAFLDANVLIYLVEGASTLAERVRERLRELAGEDAVGQPVAMSRLSWLECRVGPLRTGDQGVLSRYDSFFALPDLICIELTAQVVGLATVLRARHGLKTPDALQAASCMQLGPKHKFLTGDKAFARVAGLNVRLVS